MADIVEKIIIDDSAAIASFQDLDKQMAKLNDKIRELEDSYKAANEAAAKSAEEAASATSNLKDQISKAVAEALKAERAQKQFNSTIYESVREIKLFGTSIGGVIDGLQKKAVAMRAVTSAVGGGTKALQLFKVALISTGIGAIVVALGSFVALLTKSQKALHSKML